MVLLGRDLELRDLEKLAACFISPELAQQAMLRRVDSAEGAMLVGQNGAGEYGGIVFPYVWPGDAHAREYRLRRDHPDLEYDVDGKPKERRKYLSPPGRGNLLYLVPGTAAEWLTDPSLPVVLVEGEKKTLALWALAWHGLSKATERPRFLPVGIAGVWSWRGTVAKAPGPDGERRNIRGPIPDLGRLTWKPRKVTIAFDINVRTNDGVKVARDGLARELRKRGAIMHRFVWASDTPAAVNGIDDLLGLWGPERALELLERSQPVNLTAKDQRSSAREFTAVGNDRYLLTLPGISVVLGIDRLRRDRHELIGELSVRCDLPGAHTIDGNLSIADFNLSSARARSERSKLLAERSNATSLDWAALVEEFCQRVLQADRAGEAAVDLRELTKPDPEDRIDVEGLILPKKHPTIFFGDGGTAKSYTALYLAGRLAERGMKVALFDWELSGEDHRERLERLFAHNMPRILYARCERPLVFEVDRLCRIARENRIDFSVFDSVAFACDGPPESAEIAGRYFRAVRQIGGGSLHVAHVSRGDGADKKPFGSAFWHNGARSTWYVKLADASAGTEVLHIGFFNRKVNLGRLCPPVGFTVTFSKDRTVFRRTEVADSPDLVRQLTVRQRMVYLLGRGAMAPEVIAEEIEADLATVKRTARRYKNLFTVLEGGRLALLEEGAL